MTIETIEMEITLDGKVGPQPAQKESNLVQRIQKDWKKTSRIVAIATLAFLGSPESDQERMAEAFSPLISEVGPVPHSLPFPPEVIIHGAHGVAPEQEAPAQRVEQVVDFETGQAPKSEDVADFKSQSELINNKFIGAQYDGDLPKESSFKLKAGTALNGEPILFAVCHDQGGKTIALIGPAGDNDYQIFPSPNRANKDLTMFWKRGTLHVFDSGKELVLEKQGGESAWRVIPSREVLLQLRANLSKEAVIPLIDRKVEVLETFNLIDMNLSGRDEIVYEIQPGDTLWTIAAKKGIPREIVFDAYKKATGEENPNLGLIQPGVILKIEMGNWFDAELKYGELAKDIPVYDFSNSNIERLRELDLALTNNLYPSITETEADPNVRKMEVFVYRSVIDKFKNDGVSFVGWANRHMGLLNSLLAESGLDLRVSLGRIIIVKDGTVKDLDEDFFSAAFLWGREPFSFSPGYFGRWSVVDDYRDGDYYNEFRDIDMGWNHENGHYFIDLWDIYPLNEDREYVVYLEDEQSQSISLKIPKLVYPANWLMYRGVERPVLSPFSIAARKRLEEVGVSSWLETSNYWRYSAFQEIPRRFFIQLKDSEGNPLKAGEVSVFISKYDEKYDEEEDKYYYERQYDSNPDFVFTFSEEEILLPFDPSGCAFVRNKKSELPGRGKNFVVFVRVKTPDGETKTFSAHLTSFDFLLATWETKEGKIPLLDVRMSEVKVPEQPLGIAPELVKDLEDKGIITNQGWFVGQTLDFETDEVGRVLAKEDAANFDSQAKLIAEEVFNSDLLEVGELAYRVGTDLSNVPVLVGEVFDQGRRNVLAMIYPSKDGYQFIFPPDDPEISGAWMFYKKGLIRAFADNNRELVWEDGKWKLLSTDRQG